MSFSIKTDIFQGPIATLHEMIEKRSLSVSEVSLALIIDDFLDFVKSLKDEYNHDHKYEISQFIYVSSILVLIKSKSLLPDFLFEEDENRSVVLLENQLKAYEIIKIAQKDIKKNFGKFNLKNLYIQTEKNKNIFIPDNSIDLNYFKNYIESRLTLMVEQENKKPEIKVEKSIHISDVLNHVRNILKRIGTLNLKNAHNEDGDERLKNRNKKTIVVFFLAVLELVKLGEIDVIQDEHMGDIVISSS